VTIIFFMEYSKVNPEYLSFFYSSPTQEKKDSTRPKQKSFAYDSNPSTKNLSDYHCRASVRYCFINSFVGRERQLREKRLREFSKDLRTQTLKKRQAFGGGGDFTVSKFPDKVLHVLRIDCHFFF